MRASGVFPLGDEVARMSRQHPPPMPTCPGLTLCSSSGQSGEGCAYDKGCKMSTCTVVQDVSCCRCSDQNPVLVSTYGISKNI